MRRRTAIVSLGVVSALVCLPATALPAFAQDPKPTEAPAPGETGETPVEEGQPDQPVDCTFTGGGMPILPGEGGGSDGSTGSDGGTVVTDPAEGEPGTVDPAPPVEGETPQEDPQVEPKPEPAPDPDAEPAPMPEPKPEPTGGGDGTDGDGQVYCIAYADGGGMLPPEAYESRPLAGSPDDVKRGEVLQSVGDGGVAAPAVAVRGTARFTG